MHQRRCWLLRPEKWRLLLHWFHEQLHWRRKSCLFFRFKVLYFQANSIHSNVYWKQYEVIVPNWNNHPENIMVIILQQNLFHDVDVALISLPVITVIASPSKIPFVIKSLIVLMDLTKIPNTVEASTTVTPASSPAASMENASKSHRNVTVKLTAKLMKTKMKRSVQVRIQVNWKKNHTREALLWCVCMKSYPKIKRPMQTILVFVFSCNRNSRPCLGNHHRLSHSSGRFLLEENEICTSQIYSL